MLREAVIIDVPKLITLVAKGLLFVSSVVGYVIKTKKEAGGE